MSEHDENDEMGSITMHLPVKVIEMIEVMSQDTMIGGAPAYGDIPEKAQANFIIALLYDYYCETAGGQKIAIEEFGISEIGTTGTREFGSFDEPNEFTVDWLPPRVL